MTGLVETLSGVIVAGWLLFWVLRVFLSAPWASFALPMMGLIALVSPAPWGIWMSVMQPFGVMLPALCLAGIARGSGLRVTRIARVDLAVLALAMTFVLMGAAGVLPLSPYGWFYGGFGPALLAGVLGGWALLRGHFVIAGAVVAAQILWIADIGSSNFYDQVSHFFLLPACLWAMLRPNRAP